MRFLRLLFLVFLVQLLVGSKLSAHTSNYGCRVDDKVYTQYLGEAHPYHPSNPLKKFYKNAAYIPIYYGYGYNQHQGYKCGFINIYPASSYYNGSQNIPIPAENEITSSVSGGCVIATSLGATPIREGDYVSYTYNKPGKCGNPTGVPLDDYTWLIIAATAVIGTYFISKKNLLSF